MKCQPADYLIRAEKPQGPGPEVSGPGALSYSDDARNGRVASRRFGTAPTRLFKRAKTAGDLKVAPTI
jgi:hypothetical protein